MPARGTPPLEEADVEALYSQGARARFGQTDANCGGEGTHRRAGQASDAIQAGALGVAGAAVTAGDRSAASFVVGPWETAPTHPPRRRRLAAATASRSTMTDAAKS